MLRLLWAAALAAALALAAVAGTFSFKPSAAVTVTTSAIGLATNTRHTFVEVCNTDPSKELRVAFDSAVTATSGRPLAGGQCIQYVGLAQGQLVYGVVAAGSLVAVVTEGFEQ